MKKILFLIPLFLSISLSAQDIITLRTGEQIRARVTEISTTELRFRLFEQPTGPIRVTPLSEVFAINFEDGTRQVFSAEVETRQPQLVNVPTRTENVRETNREQATTNRPQQGDWALGVNFQVAIDAPTSYGIGAKILFNATNTIRLETSFAYLFVYSEGNVSVGMWDLNFNTHFLVPLGDNVTFYPLAGFGILGVTERNDGRRQGGNFFGINFGAGVDFNISRTLTFNIEPRYKIITEFGMGGIFFTQVGLAFRF